MLKKIILSAIIGIGLNTIGLMAKSKTDLMTLASRQEVLSHTITKDYRKQDNSSLMADIRTFESGQRQLSTQIKNPEISNLLAYLNLCLKDLEQVVKRPHTSKNAQRVAELTASISEGSHYIVASL